MKHFQIWALMLAFTFNYFNTSAQSTSRWIKVALTKDQNYYNTEISNYASYVTLNLLQVNLNPSQNWYSKLVSSRRKAFVSTELNINYPDGKTITDARTTEGRDLPRSGEVFSLGGGSLICQKIPATFKKMNFTLKVNTTSNDKFDEFLQITNEVSKNSPELSMVSAIPSGFSGVKSLLDGMFNRQLIKTYINCSQDITPDGNTKPGVYVCFAADDRSFYEKYELENQALIWDGNILTFKGQVVKDVSYFVTSLKAEKSIFPPKSIDILSDKTRNWAPLYATADKIANTYSLNDTLKAKQEIELHLTIGYTLLSADPSLVHSEITSSGIFLRDYINKTYTDRKKSLLGNPNKVPAKSTKTEEDGLLNNIIKNFKSINPFK
jgi:hypothetical protein